MSQFMVLRLYFFNFPFLFAIFHPTFFPFPSCASLWFTPTSFFSVLSSTFSNYPHVFHQRLVKFSCISNSVFSVFFQFVVHSFLSMCLYLSVSRCVYVLKLLFCPFHSHFRFVFWPQTPLPLFIVAQAGTHCLLLENTGVLVLYVA